MAPFHIARGMVWSPFVRQDGPHAAGTVSLVGPRDTPEARTGLATATTRMPVMPTRKRGAGGPAVTVAFPKELPVRKGQGDAWWLELPGRELRLSNLDKVFWPREGYTKGDIVAYYYNVADLLLPHLERRPLTMKRMPDGAEGPSFYEKTAPSHTPEWVNRCTVLSEDAKAGRIDYLTVDNLDTLLFVANLGAIE